MRFGQRLLVSVFGGLVVSITACASDLEDNPDASDAGETPPAADGSTAPDSGKNATDGSTTDASTADGSTTDASPATCTNGTKDGDESDVDCGGTCATKCAGTKSCVGSGDCADGLVCTSGTCAAVTATDGVKNGTETDVDCGGGAAPKCADGKACATAATDCTSGVCTGNVCQVPSPTDGVKNGSETDADCGGAGATTARCPVGKACLAASDCFQGFCVTNVCAEPPSCRTAGNGKDTCGPMSNESCCTTLGVPGGTYKQLDNAAFTVTISPYKLDKYEITQGRLREFYAAFAGDLYGNPPAAGAGANPHVASSGWQSVWNDRLPRNMTEVSDRLSTDNGCFGASDAHTWTNTASSNDTKAVNCVDWYTLAAFCIWDGGRLPTEAEWGLAAEGGSEQRKFAWGNTPDASVSIPAGNDPNTYGSQAGLYVVHAFCSSGGGPSCFSYGTTTRVDGDGPAHISPPGRKLDIARWGHHDMSGNLIEWTVDAADNSNPCAGTDCARVSWPDFHVDRKDPSNKTILGDRSIGGLPSYWRNYSYGNDAHDLDARYHLDGGRVMRGGSWEVAHPVSVRNRYGSYPVWRAYYAAGARCARD